MVRSHNRWAASVEVNLASDDRDRPLSKEAEEYDDLIRETHAAQEELAGRRKADKPSGGRKWPSGWKNPVYWLALVLLMVWMVFATNAARWPWDDSDAADTAKQVDESSTMPSSAPDTVSSLDAGGLSGIWDMYATNVEGNDRQVFTVQFVGTDSGTLDILNDDTEFDTVFRVLDGGKVWFTFTRIFPFMPSNSPAIEWPEISVFEGTFVGPGEIVGEWGRDDWDCVPDRDPPCKYRSDAVGMPSRLVRQ